ncbi:MAG: hypothetical protein PHW31_00140 [Candidatus Pacebacteria bacterium]|nr:hypothetical protein [Candidatus Paceibacterota bacterium]
MSEEKELGNRERFLKIYANLPIAVRQEIILVLDDNQPITWNAAFIEVNANTELSKVILKKLQRLEII